MAQRAKKAFKGRTLGNQRRGRVSLAEALSLANRRAHEQANRRSGRRELKSVRAAIAATDFDDAEHTVVWVRRMTRWLVGMLLLPLCWVTTWTLLSRFSRATMEYGFWQTREFWYFTTGMLVMMGWFWSGLAQRFFLYLYVLGHELTHAVFVWIFRGKVTEFRVSADGGYITTNKTNLVIALSPYFVPFWSMVCAAIYVVLRHTLDLKPVWDLVFYGAMGCTWTFHMVWTVWMIPRDQPDLKENGTFLSLVVIYLANVLVLVGLLCMAEKSPWRNTVEFCHEWVRHAATWGDMIWRGMVRAVSDFRTGGRF